MNDDTANLPANYNFTYSSALYANIRPITHYPELNQANKRAISLDGENTQSAGDFTVSRNGSSKEVYVEATFYNDELDLAPLEDEFLQIYE